MMMLPRSLTQDSWFILNITIFKVLLSTQKSTKSPKQISYYKDAKWLMSA